MRAKVGLFAVTVVVAAMAPAHDAEADLLRETARTRAFALETVEKLRAVSGAAPAPLAGRPEALLRQAGARPHRAHGSDLERVIVERASWHGINPDFVRAVVQVESGYNPGARSPKGAMGLMQLMPATAAALGVRDPWNPEDNVDGGVRFLRSLLAEFGNAEAALIAYNAGPEVVRRGWRVPEETRAYVRSVMAHFRRLRVVALP
jgi:soluble lytic murein transglycosylase-like protein